VEENYNALDNLLKQVSFEIELQKRLPPKFNVFELCGIQHYEARHSAILTGILGWNGSREPLREFLRLFCDIDDPGCLRNVSVITEHKIRIKREDRRLDIFIKIDNEIYIAIENKIYTEDHSGQLEAYSEWLEKQQPQSSKRFLFYLTLGGRKSSEWEEKEKYICLSYQEDILKFLRSCAKITNIDQRFNSAILQYIEFWENRFMQADELKNKTCKKILSSLENFQAAKQIYETFWGAKIKLIKDALSEWQENVKKDKKLSIIEHAMDLSGTNQYEKMSFIWNDDFFISFEFVSKNFLDLAYGISCPISKNDRPNIAGWDTSDWWPAFKYISDGRVKYIGNNPDICFEQDLIKNVLNAALGEILSLLEERKDIFGEKKIQGDSTSPSPSTTPCRDARYEDKIAEEP